MKTNLVIGLLAAAVAAAGGYWLGARQEKLGADGTASPAPAAADGRKILYYRNPMGLPDTSPTPKKDPMGMDYIPVYADEAAAADDAVKVSPARLQTLGVRTEAAALRALPQRVHASGRVAVDERRVFAVTPKFEGWIETLHAAETGQPVVRGQPLFEVYSPELVSAQREYQVAAQGIGALAGASPEAQASIRQVADAALARLSNWDISSGQIERLKAGGEPTRTLTFRAPAGGVVLEKKAVQGMRFAPGETLYQIADISTVWVLADVAERDIGALAAGQPATVSVAAYPGRSFAGRIAYVYPTLDAQTRTVPLRIELPNPGGLLKPAMFAAVDVDAGAPQQVLAVPASAVIDSGARQTVIVAQPGDDGGRFAPREVQLGARGDDYVEVRAGLREGEQVVVAANFLIDSESNLKAALGGLSAPPPADAGAPIGHRAVGVLDAIAPDTGTLTISHEAVPELKWPAMTMEFLPANTALATHLKPGMAVAFEFVERDPGEWVITRIEKR